MENKEENFSVEVYILKRDMKIDLDILIVKNLQYLLVIHVEKKVNKDIVNFTFIMEAIFYKNDLSQSITLL